MMKVFPVREYTDHNPVVAGMNVDGEKVTSQTGELGLTNALNYIEAQGFEIVSVMSTEKTRFEPAYYRVVARRVVVTANLNGGCHREAHDDFEFASHDRKIGI